MERWRGKVEQLRSSFAAGEIGFEELQLSLEPLLRQATGCSPRQQKEIEEAINNLEIIRFTKREDQWGPLVSEILQRMFVAAVAADVVPWSTEQRVSHDLSVRIAVYRMEWKLRWQIF
jgi:hypothetical protein